MLLLSGPGETTVSIRGLWLRKAEGNERMSSQAQHGSGRRVGRFDHAVDGAHLDKELRRLLMRGKSMRRDRFRAAVRLA